MRTLLPLIAALVATSAAAATPDVTFGAHLASLHADPGFNNRNFGVYAMYRGFVVGGYQNSEGRPSAYAAYSWRPAPHVAVNVGLVTGYRAASPTVLVAASLIGPKVWGVRPVLTFVPPLAGVSPLFNIGLEF